MFYAIYALPCFFAVVVLTAGQTVDNFPYDEAHPKDSCHGPRITRQISSNPLLNILGNFQTIPDYIEEYPEALAEDYPSQLDYVDLERTSAWPKPKRSSVSPFISLGALSNLPQFFEQLKGSMEKSDKPVMHQAYNVASLPQSAASGECQRAQRRRPDRRNRSRKHVLSSCMKWTVYSDHRQLLPFCTHFGIIVRCVVQEATRLHWFTGEDYYGRPYCGFATTIEC